MFRLTCHLHIWQNDLAHLRATAVTRGWNGQNKSQRTKLTLKQKILPPLLPGFARTNKLSRLSIYLLNTSLITCRKFRSSYLGKATAAARAVLPTPTSVCGVIVFIFYDLGRCHHHQSLNREGSWDTTDDFATSFLHFSLFSTALWDLPNSRPVHSLMLSSHLSFCLHGLLPPFTVPCKRFLVRPYELSLIHI